MNNHEKEQYKHLGVLLFTYYAEYFEKMQRWEGLAIADAISKCLMLTQKESKRPVDDKTYIKRICTDIIKADLSTGLFFTDKNRSHLHTLVNELFEV